MLKIHTFRLIRDEAEMIDCHMELKDRYPLYAITTDKKLAKRFIKERNMKQFIYTVIKKDSDSDTAEYMRGHQGCKLNTYDLETFVDKFTKRQDSRFVNILATDDEVSYMGNTIETYHVLDLLTKEYIPSSIFTEEIYEILKYIGYVAMERFVTTNKCVAGGGVGNIVVGPDEDFDLISASLSDLYRFNFDQFNVFVALHENLLGSGFYEAVQYREEPLENKLVTEPASGW